MRILAFLLFGMVTMACSPASKERIISNQDLQKDRPIGFVHNVYVWLKKDVTPLQRLAFEKASAKLAEIESVVQYSFGPPADTPRDIVDNSYDYAINVSYENKKGHDLYQVDPLHTDFLNSYMHLVEKITIYDNLIIEP